LTDENTAIIAVVGVLGLVAIVGLFLFMARGNSGGSVAVLDQSGNLLYTISDQPRRVVGSVPFEPTGF